MGTGAWRLAGVVVLVASFALSFPAQAVAENETMNFHSVTLTFPVTPGPCPGEGAGIVTYTFNGVMHTTNDSAGGIHFTFTATGDFMFVPSDPTQLSSSGHATMWFGGNVLVYSSGVIALSGTFSLHGTASDGSSFQFNSVAHLAINPDGKIVSSVMNFNCH